MNPPGKATSVLIFISVFLYCCSPPEGPKVEEYPGYWNVCDGVFPFNDSRRPIHDAVGLDGVLWAINDDCAASYDGFTWTKRFQPTYGWVHSIDGIDGSNIWIGTAGGEIYYFNGSWWGVQFDDTSYCFTVIAANTTNDVWAISEASMKPADTDFFHFNGSIWEKRTINGFPSSCEVESADVSPKGDLWVSSSRGLYKISGNNASLAHPNTDFLSVNVLSDSSVYCLGERTLYRYSQKGWDEFPVPVADRLVDLIVYANGQAFVSSNVGSLFFDGNKFLSNSRANRFNTCSWFGGSGLDDTYCVWDFQLIKYEE